MRIRLPLSIQALALVLLGLAQQAQADSLKVDLPRTGSVPPGFESMIAGQTQLIELHLLGRKLGLYSGFVTPDSVTFADPQDIVEALPLAPLSEQDRANLLERLRLPLKRNNQLACSNQILSSDGCGYLSSDALDIIYSEAEGRADLFLKNAWLNHQQSTNAVLVTPTQGTERAFLQRQSMTAATSSGYRSIAADASAALGVSDNSFFATDYRILYNASQYGQSQRQQTNLDVGDLYYRYDLERRYYTQFGRISARNLSEPSGGSFGFRSLPIGRMHGVRVGTTRAYLNNKAGARRTPVMVQLTRPARVDAYRGAQLLSTAYFNAGMHSVDTAGFPPGSYMVSLRIIEDGRYVRSEQQPFSRVDSGAGKPGDVQWFMQAGKRDETDGSAARGMAVLGGVGMALTERSSLTVGLAHQNKAAYGEVRLDHQYPTDQGVLSTSATLFGGTDGSRSNAQEIYWSGPFMASIYRTSSRTNARTSSPIATRSANNHSGVANAESLTASLSKSIARWTVTGAYTRINSDTSYAAQLLADSGYGSERPMNLAPNMLPARQWRQRSQTTGMQLSLNRVFNIAGLDVNTSLSLYQRRTDGASDRGAFLSFTFAHAAPSRNNRIDFDANTSAGVSMEKMASGSAARLNGSQTFTRNGTMHQEFGVNIDVAAKESLDLNLYARLQGKLGDAYASVAHHYDVASNHHTPSFSGTYSSTVAVTRSGVMLGGDTGGTAPMAGILVSARGDDNASDQALARVRGYSGIDYRLNAGDHILLPAAAFHAVTTEVSDPDARHGGGIASVKSGAGVRDWFVLPGHIGVHEVSSIVTYTYLGQLHIASNTDDAGNRQLAGGTILDAIVPDINDDGSFVSDFHFTPSVLNVLKGRQLYQCHLPQTEPSESSVRNVGSIECAPALVGSLPKPLLSDQRVLRLLSKNGVAGAPDVNGIAGIGPKLFGAAGNPSTPHRSL